MSSKVEIDTSEFDKNSAGLLEQLGEFTKSTLRRAASAFAHFAARFTPPDVREDKIKKERYFRPIYNLKELIDSGKAITLDKYQYKKGKRWKVFDDKHNKILAYTTSQSEAKKLAKIETRGLMKVMWGKSLPDIGGNVPAAIQRLLSKSPALRQLPYSESALEEKDGEVSVEIENKATGIERVSAMAEANGYRAAEKTLKVMQQFMDREREI